MNAREVAAVLRGKGLERVIEGNWMIVMTTLGQFIHVSARGPLVRSNAKLKPRSAKATKKKNAPCRCGASGRSLHTCPYEADLFGTEKLCNCCTACEKKCAEEV